MTDNVKLLYPGLSEKEYKLRVSVYDAKNEFHDPFVYPNEPSDEKYKEFPTDSEADRKRKAIRRKKYRDARRKELVDSVEELDQIRHVAGVVFEKNVEKTLDLDEMRQSEITKLAVWVKKGLLKLVQGKLVSKDGIRTLIPAPEEKKHPQPQAQVNHQQKQKFGKSK